MSSITVNRNKKTIEKITGFYNYKNESNKFLRVQNIDTDLDGVIRFNNNNFEGYDGNKWILFHSVKGDKGDKGDNYSDKFIFKNLSNSLEDGLIFRNEKFVKNDNDEDIIETRVLKSGYLNYNNKNIKTLNIETLEKEIILKNNRLPPMIHNFSNLKIDELRSNENDLEFKAYGEVNIYNVKGNIKKGQFVELDLIDNLLFVKAFNYEEIVDNFTEPKCIVGIALEDSLEKEKIKVCNKGITTVRCNTDSSKINSNYINSSNIDKIGTNCLIDMEGFAFVSIIKPKRYFFGGNFIETGKIDENKKLFLIKINF